MASMLPAPLPALPPELMSRIVREALAAEGGDVQAWFNLRRVCRCFRDSLRGVAIKVELRRHLAPEQLQAALVGKPVASVTLHDSHLVQKLTNGNLVPALVYAAPQLTALHGLPLAELEFSRVPEVAKLASLRVLTLRQLPVARCQYVRGDDLPLGLEELQMEASNPLSTMRLWASSASLAAFSLLQSLRQVTLAGFDSEPLNVGQVADGQLRRCGLPRCLEVVRLENRHAQLSDFFLGAAVPAEEQAGDNNEPGFPVATLQTCANVVTLELVYALQQVPGAFMAEWDGQDGTLLDWNFSRLRMETACSC